MNFFALGAGAEELTKISHLFFTEPKVGLSIRTHPAGRLAIERFFHFGLGLVDLLGFVFPIAPLEDWVKRQAMRCVSSVNDKACSDASEYVFNEISHLCGGVWGMAALAQRTAPNDGIKIERLRGEGQENHFPQPRVLHPWRAQGRVQG